MPNRKNPEFEALLTPHELRERRRAELVAAKQRKERLNKTAEIGGWIVVLFIAAGLAALISGLLWWAAIAVWQGALSTM